MSTEPADEPLEIGIDQLAARLPDEARLRVAKGLIVAAYEITPKDRGEFRKESPGPMSLALANFALDLINYSRALDVVAEMRAMQEQQSAVGDHGVH